MWSCLKFDYPFIVPQGGNNFYGTLGCSEIMKNVALNPDYIFVASGTGNTASGLLISLKEHQKLYAVSALKGDFMKGEIESSTANFFMNKEQTETSMQQLEVLSEYHFGGFAKQKPEFIQFIQEFYLQHQIKLDPIYTGKMMMAIYDQIKKNNIPENTTILAIHTGGLQGVKGFEDRYNLKLF